MVASTKAPTMEESERLRGDGDKINFNVIKMSSF